MSRPRRGAKVVYREIDSDDSDFDYDELTKVVTIEPIHDDSDDDDYKPTDSVISTLDLPSIPKVVYPPLSPLQLQLRKVCRLGDKELLQTFLSDNPGVELDVKDPDGGTILTETVTKTAQFCDIANILIDAGAGLEVTDSVGNTPLHNAVLYYPSTQKTVDLLLKHGADMTAKNNAGDMPEKLSDDKDLKQVLQELRKAAGRKKCLEAAVNTYMNSEDMRRKVYDKVLMEERFSQVITVRYNAPVTVQSPGLLKRKRKLDCLDDSQEGSENRTKRIRWCELDSTGTEIDPQFSSEEEEERECVVEEPDLVDNSSSEQRADSEEDVVIVHQDVKKVQLLQSDTELCLNKPCDKSQVQMNDSSENEDVETYFVEPIPAASTPQYSEQQEAIENTQTNSESPEEENDRLQTSGSDHVVEAVNETTIGEQNVVPLKLGKENIEDEHEEKTEKGFEEETKEEFTETIEELVEVGAGDNSKNELNKESADQAVAADSPETIELNEESKEICDDDNSENEKDQLVLKCSQGFGFFIS